MKLAVIVALMPLVSAFAPGQSLAPQRARAADLAPTMRMGGFGGFRLRGGGFSGKRFNIGNKKGGLGNFGGGNGASGMGGGGNGINSANSVGDAGDEPNNNKALNIRGGADGGLAGFISKYEGWCTEAPLLTKGMTSFCGFLLGDLMAQFLIEKTDKYDWYRTFRLASFGFLVHGTTGHWFYGKLDGAIPGKGGAAVATKVFIDQVLWNPIFGIMFLGYMGLAQGMGVAGTVAEIKSKLITSVTGSWTVWPIAHTINFRFVPTDVRILYINSIQIFYNCFLSILASKE